MTLRLSFPDPCITKRFGTILARHLARGYLLTLQGDLGVGKTTLARAVITASLERDGRAEPIPSPTFSLIQTYETAYITLTHADLYRIGSATAMRELDLQGALDAGALLVEWPRFLEGLSPLGSIDITLAFAPNEQKHPHTRIAEIHADNDISDSIYSEIGNFLL